MKLKRIIILINNKKVFLYPVVAFLNENISTVQSSKVVIGVP